MDWLPSITTTTLLGVAIWLSRNLIITRLKNAVRHEYNSEIEELKGKLRQNEELLKAELRKKETQIEALRSEAIKGVSNRQALIF